MTNPDIRAIISFAERCAAKNAYTLRGEILSLKAVVSAFVADCDLSTAVAADVLEVIYTAYSTEIVRILYDDGKTP